MSGDGGNPVGDNERLRQELDLPDPSARLQNSIARIVQDHLNEAATQLLELIATPAERKAALRTQLDKSLNRAQKEIQTQLAEQVGSAFQHARERLVAQIEAAGAGMQDALPLSPDTQAAVESADAAVARLGQEEEGTWKNLPLSPDSTQALQDAEAAVAEQAAAAPQLETEEEHQGEWQLATLPLAPLRQDIQMLEANPDAAAASKEFDQIMQDTSSVYDRFLLDWRSPEGAEIIASPVASAYLTSRFYAQNKQRQLPPPPTEDVQMEEGAVVPSSALPDGEARAHAFTLSSIAYAGQIELDNRSLDLPTSSVPTDEQLLAATTAILEKSNLSQEQLEAQMRNIIQAGQYFEGFTGQLFDDYPQAERTKKELLRRLEAAHMAVKAKLEEKASTENPSVIDLVSSSEEGEESGSDPYWPSPQTRALLSAAAGNDDAVDLDFALSAASDHPDEGVPLLENPEQSLIEWGVVEPSDEERDTTQIKEGKQEAVRSERIAPIPLDESETEDERAPTKEPVAPHGASASAEPAESTAVSGLSGDESFAGGYENITDSETDDHLFGASFKAFDELGFDSKDLQRFTDQKLLKLPRSYVNDIEKHDGGYPPPNDDQKAFVAKRVATFCEQMEKEWLPKFVRFAKDHPADREKIKDEFNYFLTHTNEIVTDSLFLSEEEKEQYETWVKDMEAHYNLDLGQEAKSGSDVLHENAAEIPLQGAHGSYREAKENLAGARAKRASIELKLNALKKQKAMPARQKTEQEKALRNEIKSIDKDIRKATEQARNAETRFASAKTAVIRNLQTQLEKTSKRIDELADKQQEQEGDLPEDEYAEAERLQKTEKDLQRRVEEARKFSLKEPLHLNVKGKFDVKMAEPSSKRENAAAAESRPRKRPRSAE